MARNLCRKSHKKIEETGNKIAKLLKVMTQPASQRILMTLKEAYTPLTWRKISKIAQVNFYSHAILSELYDHGLVKPVVLEEERVYGWTLATDLIEKIIFLLELHINMPPPPPKSVLKLEKKIEQLQDAVQDKKYFNEKLIKKAQILKDSGDIEGYEVLMRLLTENVF